MNDAGLCGGCGCCSGRILHETPHRQQLTGGGPEVVEERLRACAEAEAERILVTRDQLLLAAEREFDPVGAVARVMHAEDLIFILSIFATTPWLPDDPVQCRKQLQLTETLTGHVLARGLVDREGLICPLLDIRARIDKGKWELRRAAQVAGTGVVR